MRHKIQQTIKTRITLITVSFSLLIAVLLSTLSFGFFRSYAQRSVIQSTEFSLQLIAGILGQELNELDMLTKWCSTSLQIAEYLEDDTGSTLLSMEVYDRLKEEFWNNRSREYIRRLIVTDTKTTRLLQSGNSMSESWPVTIYNLPQLRLAGIEYPQLFRFCTQDPYAIGSQPQVIPVIRPIRKVGSRDVIGHVYLAVSADVVLSHLENYYMPPDCNLYLELPGTAYRLDGTLFTGAPGFKTSTVTEKQETLSDKTIVREVEMNEGETSLMISCPLGFEGIYLSQTLSLGQIDDERRLYMNTLALISVAVLAFGLFISMLLGRIITRPVLELRRKIDDIAKSDFSHHPGIEWDNELGDIGRGINDMSGKIVSLMESRLADESKKRDLEYRMLQSQINPHFLYNTLNSIKWMASIQNATGIAEMTTALSRLMKNVIKGSRTIVSLKEELALLDDYFLIQQYRYGGAIAFEKKIPESLERVSIPCFTMQPLMENAIFHGIEPKGGTGTITVTASRRPDGDVEIVMTDDGIGMTEELIAEVLSPEGHSGSTGLFKEIGVSSVDKRLGHSYGSAYGLGIESEVGRFTRATLLVPFIIVTAPEAKEKTQ